MPQKQVEVPIVLPTEDECRQCVLRLQEHMEHTRGVSEVHVNDRGRTMTVSFDPDLLTFRGIEERAKEACSELAESYCHHNLILGGLDCADCARSIERAVERREGVLYVSANFASARLFVEYDCRDHLLEQIASDVRGLGYEVWTEEEYKAQRAAGETRPFYLRNRRSLVTLASFVLLLVGVVLWLNTPEPHLAAIGFLAAAAVIGGYSVARNGVNTVIRTRNVDMNVLMTVAVIGAAAVGEWVEAALVVVLFGLGETLEGWAVERTRGSIQQLIDLSPDVALIRHGDHEERIPVEQVAVGQVIVIKPGDRIALDGVVVKGHSAVDESPITGESMPRGKAVDDQVFAGTINQNGTLEVQVTAPAGNTTLDRLITLVQEAQGQKAPSERWVDAFAKYYTPAVMVIALLTAVFPPLLLGAAWDTWIYRALALLILACPCALVISTPVTIVAAIGAASRQGVLIKGGAHLEAAGSLRALAFDKTGTLTEGLPRVTHVANFNGFSKSALAATGNGHAGDGSGGNGNAGNDSLGDDHAANEILAMAAALEKDSEHPLAEAILHAATARDLDLETVHDFEAVPGRGARGRLNGGSYLIGNARLYEEQGIALEQNVLDYLAERQSRGETVVILGTSDGAIGAIAIADELRPVSRGAIQDLREAGIEHLIMLTGDNERTAAAVAERAGLDEYKAELLPEHKVDAIKELLERYGQVGMIGDGINDAPALATATVGLAMGSAGSDTAIETADIALMADDLTRVPFTIRLSRAARHTVRQNIGFALGIKVLATLLVFPGLLTLWMAVLADTGASLVVILNGLRLLRHGREEAVGAEAVAVEPREEGAVLPEPAPSPESLEDEHLHARIGISAQPQSSGLPSRLRQRESPALVGDSCGCSGEAAPGGG